MSGSCGRSDGALATERAWQIRQAALVATEQRGLSQLEAKQKLRVQRWWQCRRCSAKNRKSDAKRCKMMHLTNTCGPAARSTSSFRCILFHRPTYWRRRAKKRKKWCILVHFGARPACKPQNQVSFRGRVVNDASSMLQKVVHVVHGDAQGRMVAPSPTLAAPPAERVRLC